ncbi:MAG TPA: 3-phosphoshikimate 1-carboxyvinyltransferase [Vicinamibacterales bacterium]
MPSLQEARIVPARRVAGRLSVPGDKSISHRYALLAALADGVSRLANYSPGADCASTLDCLRRLGVRIERDPSQPRTVVVHGRGLGRLAAPDRPLDAGNSGTTTRLLAGIVAAHPFTSTITGDESLCRRPMGRVIDPLTRMGARIESADGRCPLRITGGRLTPIDYATPVPSAQVKSAILLAGLHTEGWTTVREPAPTRNHTELALAAFGATVDCEGTIIRVKGGTPLSAVETTIPGDVSSATFWAVAAAALPGSDVEIADLGLNPSRTALFDVLERAGAGVERQMEGHRLGEPKGRVRVRHRELRPLVLTAADVPALIDELPALAAMAAIGGDLHVTGAAELRVKESDRISALAAGLRTLGVDIDEFPDGFHVRGGRRLRGGVVDAAHDHRLAMAFAVAALAADGPTTILGADVVDVSYPGFFEQLAALTRED